MTCDSLLLGRPLSLPEERCAAAGEAATREVDEMSAAPALVRIAGLSARTIELLGRDVCGPLLDAVESTERELARCRARMVDSLGAALPTLDARTRRAALAARRDCFNGRSLRASREGPTWGELVQITKGLADEVIVLEAAVQERQAAFGSAFERELERERACIFGWLRDRRFLRGITLGNPEIGRRAKAQRPSGADTTRRERKLAQTVLRYGVRAALKLSPFSTLTCVGLATVLDGAEMASFRYTAGDRRETSLVRADRAVLDWCQVALLRHPLVRQTCQVAWNDTAEEIAPKQYRLLRPAAWRVSPGNHAFSYEPSTQVTAKLSGPLLAAVRRHLGRGPMGYAQLVGTLADEMGEAESRDATARIHAGVDQLISVGILSLLPSWPTHELHLERRLAAILRALPGDPALAAMREALETLVALEEGYAADPVPDRSAEGILRAEDRVADSAAAMTGISLAPDVARARGIFEDVFLTVSSPLAEEGELLQLAAPMIGDLMDVGELVACYTSLFNHRHDVLHTLAAFWKRNLAGQAEIRFLDLFQIFQPLWREYLRFDRDYRNIDVSTFNPLHLREIEDLKRLRAEIPAALDRAMQPVPTGVCLSPSALAAALSEIPTLYRPLLGSCLFVQPANASGSLWVLNRIFEGTGRYMSRHTAAMDESMRARFVRHFTARSMVAIGDERAELLDLFFTHGSMTNLRFPQTWRVLALPGEQIDIPGDRLVGLAELGVRANLATTKFTVVDRAGCALAPVHMSSLGNLFMPAVLRFLSLFGPYETRQVVPRPARVELGSTQVTRRLTCGRLVLRRKRWEVRGHAGVREPWDMAAPEAFAWAQGWRARHDIPVQAFVYEQIHAPGDAVPSFKPQYVDFRSPSLVELLMTILRKSTGRLIVEEPLPGLSDLPLDSDREPRAFELQLDSLALNAGCVPPVDRR